MEKDELINCKDCDKLCEDATVLVCGLYCYDCLNKLLNSLDTNSNEFRCIFCDKTHKKPAKGFKRYNSMVSCSVYQVDSVEKFKISLNYMKSSLDEIKKDFENPEENIRDHYSEEKKDIDLHVDLTIRYIKNLRNSLFENIDHIEKKTIDALSENRQKFNIVNDFLTETNGFYDEWNNYLKQMSISNDEVNKAYQMVKVFDNKIPIFEKKLKNIIFNEEISYFEPLSKGSFFGGLNQYLIHGVNFEKLNFKSNDDFKITHFEYLSNDEVLIVCYDDQILNINIFKPSSQKTTASYSFVYKDNSSSKFSVGLLDKFIIMYNNCSGNYHLFRFIKSLLPPKKLQLDSEIIAMTTNQNHIFLFSNVPQGNIQVLTYDFVYVYSLGQTKCQVSSFCFSNTIRKFFVRNNKIICLYPDEIVMMDQVNGNRLKVIEIKSDLMKMDLKGNIYLLDRERSLLVIYDFNGDLLDEVELINLPEKVDFYITPVNEIIFIINDNEISNF